MCISSSYGQYHVFQLKVKSISTMVNFPTSSIPTSSIPTLSTLTKWELTKWELTKWEIDQMGIDKVGIDKVGIDEVGRYLLINCSKSQLKPQRKKLFLGFQVDYHRISQLMSLMKLSASHNGLSIHSYIVTCQVHIFVRDKRGSHAKCAERTQCTHAKFTWHYF